MRYLIKIKIRRWYQIHAGTQGGSDRGDQRSLQKLKDGIEKSEDKLFFIKHIYIGST